MPTFFGAKAKDFMRCLKNIHKFADGQASLLDYSADTLDSLTVLLSPKSGLYEGGRFVFKISLPEEYPTAPPQTRCETNIYHPNINMDIEDDYNVCFSLFDDWNDGIFGIEDVINGLLFLLNYPNVSDPWPQYIDPAMSERRFRRNVRLSLAGLEVENGGDGVIDMKFEKFVEYDADKYEYDDTKNSEDEGDNEDEEDNNESKFEDEIDHPKEETQSSQTIENVHHEPDAPDKEEQREVCDNAELEVAALGSQATNQQNKDDRINPDVDDAALHEPSKEDKNDTESADVPPRPSIQEDEARLQKYAVVQHAVDTCPQTMEHESPIAPGDNLATSVTDESQLPASQPVCVQSVECGTVTDDSSTQDIPADVELRTGTSEEAKCDQNGDDANLPNSENDGASKYKVLDIDDVLVKINGVIDKLKPDDIRSLASEEDYCENATEDDVDTNEANTEHNESDVPMDQDNKEEGTENETPPMAQGHGEMSDRASPNGTRGDVAGHSSPEPLPHATSGLAAESVETPLPQQQTSEIAKEDSVPNTTVLSRQDTRPLEDMEIAGRSNSKSLTYNPTRVGSKRCMDLRTLYSVAARRCLTGSVAMSRQDTTEWLKLQQKTNTTMPAKRTLSLSEVDASAPHAKRPCPPEHSRGHGSSSTDEHN